MLADAFAVLAEQLALITPEAEEVRRSCRQIRDLAASASTRRTRRIASRLAGLLAEADPMDSAPVVDLLGGLLPRLDRPAALLAPLLESEDTETSARGLELALDLVEAGTLACDQRLLRLVARRFAGRGRSADTTTDDPDEDLDPELADRLAAAIDRRYPAPARGRPRGLQRLLLETGDDEVRHLAARLLDRRGGLPSARVAEAMLGAEAWQVLRPYLAYTRAGHVGLSALCAGGRVPRRVVDDFRRATERHGEALVRKVLSFLGWEQLSQGLRIEELVRLDWPGTAPLFVRPEEVGLFATDPPPARQPACHLVTARGGHAPAGGGKGRARDPVDRFRRINIAHAELLSEILETAPASRRKIVRIVRLMDGVVEAFHDLFAHRSEQYAILPDVWRRLRDRTMAMLADLPEDQPEDPPDDRPLGADLVRLVLAFEDPATLGEVRTIHGLKRLLHQEGLRLGFELVDTGQSPSHTVDLLLLPAQGDPVPGPTVRYAELEAAPEIGDDPWLPHPVRLAVEGLAWQLLHGTTAFPGLDVFVFGNEVHYYVSFRNHPAFLRVDFSPPQRGGMLDLEYYGVSNYESGLHPNPELDAICTFYRALELDVRTEGTRLFVRYDKERSHSLADLQEKVAAVLRLAPFLMDVDWVIGSLQLPPRLRGTVVDAWAERFVRSGLFPAAAVLTGDRRRILLERTTGPSGEEETVWSGEGAYRDCWWGETPPDLWDVFTREAARLGLPSPRAEAREWQGPLPLLAVHRHILQPVRRRLAAGQLQVSGGRLEPADPRLCRQEHETALFARLLASGDRASERLLTGAVGMAPVLATLEKFVHLQTTGCVGALRVERGRFALRGGELRIYAARDEHGVTRLGACSFADRLLLRRTSTRARWRSNACTDAESLWALLRGANYAGDGLVGREPDPAGALADLRRLARRRGSIARDGLSTDGGVLDGVAAAPGRATGRAVFGTDARRAEDLAGCLLVAREIRPSDSGALMQAAGVLSTGGAVLSHAALLAIQFGKPAMVVDAAWDESGPLPALVYKVTLYRGEETEIAGLPVCRRSVTAHTSGRLEEGDLCVMDTGRQQVRVLGQDADTLVLWQGFQVLARSQSARQLATDPQQVLEIRAQLLRARHQVKKALARITAAEVAGFAVEEIVLGEEASRLPVAQRAEFVDELLANPAVRDRVRPRLQELTRHLADRCRAAVERYVALTPAATCQHEVVCRRLRCLRLLDSLTLVLELQERCGVTADPASVRVDPPGDGPAIARLTWLETDLQRQLDAHLGTGDPLGRHLVRRLQRLHRILPVSGTRRDKVARAARDLERRDRRVLGRLRAHLTLPGRRCGLETHALLGWKGANLAEMDRLAGSRVVPPWFAVTDTAFDRVLAQPLAASPTADRHLPPGGYTLGSAIDGILALERSDCAVRADLIGRLWQEVELPAELVGEIERAHAGLLAGDDADRHVALRSSSCDEDTESSMQAGVYDTFLYVRGLESVLEHLRRTWAGMWSERALYGRRRAGDPTRRPAGGVIVQRMVDARVSGVLQTVNVAGDNLRELVISVGLGLGEGIVSGLVAADLVTVVKDQGPDRHPVHFTYLTNDKPSRMVFDTRRGRGTRLVETLYHQRLRPAIEYTELCEITRRALALEAAYGYPLDMEFALEGDRLWLLQARPITAILAEHETTVRERPLQMPPRRRPTTGDRP